MWYLPHDFAILVIDCALVILTEEHYLQRTIFLLFLCMPLFFCFAQKESAIWYFGIYAGLDFNSGTPVALTDGALSTREGSAAISDSSGNLLFYTDGITVWNRNHQPMPNGTGLKGHSTTTQSALIIPFPTDPDKYYIFTLGFALGTDGLHYSEVDMALDGGLGDVTTKNFKLADNMTERMTAVKHTNGQDVWLMGREYGSSRFLAYLVTAAGINTSPVASTIGPYFEDVGYKFGSRGQMKFSPNGAYLAQAGSFSETFEIYRFDSTTGLVSNMIDLSASLVDVPGFREGRPYGVEFSPDGSKLYVGVSAGNNFSGAFGSYLYQFDVTSYSATAILNSGTYIDPGNSSEIGALQLGIDGNIYVLENDYDYLGVIRNPDASGAASDFVRNGVYLGGHRTFLGLPTYIQSYFVGGIQVNDLCLGDNTEFSIVANGLVLSIQWDFGDGNISNLENPVHTYSGAGNYTVTVDVTTASGTETRTRDITINETPVANPPAAYAVCDHDNDGFFSFELSQKDTEILGTQDPNLFEVSYHATQADADAGADPLQNIYTNTNAQTETIYARVQNKVNTSCYDTTSLQLAVYNSPVVHAVTDWEICDDDNDGRYEVNLSEKTLEILGGQSLTDFSLYYYATEADALSELNPILGLYENISNPQQIYYRLENLSNANCYRIASFLIEVFPTPAAHQPSDLIVCDTDETGSAIFDLTTKDAEVLNGQESFTI